MDQKIKKNYITINEMKTMLIKHRCDNEENPYLIQYLKKDKKNLLIHCSFKKLIEQKLVKKNNKYFKMNDNSNQEPINETPYNPNLTIYLIKNPQRSMNYGKQSMCY